MSQQAWLESTDVKKSDRSNLAMLLRRRKKAITEERMLLLLKKAILKEVARFRKERQKT
mgnify:CR=1 FL=1